jgi:hypothetical protein
MFWQKLKGLLFLPSSDLCKYIAKLKVLGISPKMFWICSAMCTITLLYWDNSFFDADSDSKFKYHYHWKNVLGVKILGSHCLCSWKQLNVSLCFWELSINLFLSMGGRLRWSGIILSCLFNNPVVLLLLVYVNTTVLYYHMLAMTGFQVP